MQFDHVHVFVADRVAAEAWYGRVLRLRRKDALAFWAADGGPLTLANDEDTVHIALFKGAPAVCRSTVAFSVGANELRDWHLHLQNALDRSLPVADHGVSWSIYFSDPDGNPYEITTYAYAAFATPGVA